MEDENKPWRNFPSPTELVNWTPREFACIYKVSELNIERKRIQFLSDGFGACPSPPRILVTLHEMLKNRRRWAVDKLLFSGLFGLVYSNAFSFENPYISMRFGLVRSTLIRWAFSSEKRWFEKCSGKCIKTKTHTYRIRVDGRKRIKMKTMTSYVPRGLYLGMRIEFNLLHNVQFYRFRTF